MPTLTSLARPRYALTSSLRELLCRLANRVTWPEADYLLDPQQRFIYCPIAKAACSSVKRWFLEISGDTRPFRGHDDARLAEYTLRMQHGAALSLLRNERVFTFTFVRNPWSRLVSAYLNKCLTLNKISERFLRSLGQGNEVEQGRVLRLQPTVTFRQFVHFLSTGNSRQFDVHWRPQYLFLRDNRFDFIGRVEQLENDFAKVSARLGIDHPLGHINVTRYDRQSSDDIVADCTPQQLQARGAYPDYRQFYPPDLQQLVGQIYARDIELFGYSFDE
jgi:hypothetical protein